MKQETSAEIALFSPAWLMALLRGQRSSGETFWVGNYGTALFHQPVLALLLVLPGTGVLPGFFAALLFVYQLLLVVALIRSHPKVATPIGWKVAGVIFTLLNAGAFAALAMTLSI
ncbi:hypothetical protein [Shimia sp. Alg240-R146]|uniref:hypothetical protein n=1 Tax=Shimia sp. Alg240-R146 TaxID=2993449 RepID=UPI0022E38CC8|nr:hypothetical protein [Shimia sp. Alg240-R146]